MTVFFTQEFEPLAKLSAMTHDTHPLIEVLGHCEVLTKSGKILEKGIVVSTFT